MKGSSYLRKVQLTGGSTYIVSLPKDWVKDVRLKPGDYIRVKIQPDGSLLITPGREGVKIEGELSTISIDASKASTPHDIAREFIACYLTGYESIEVRFDPRTAGYKTHLKNIMRRKLIGMEVLEEAAERMLARCLIGYTELPVKDAVNRMYVMALSMHKDVITALLSGNTSLAREVIERDDEIDRLYFFVVRQLKRAVENRFMIEEVGLSRPIDCLGYRIVVKSIERIGDHATKMAEAMLRIDELPKSLAGMLSEISLMSEISRDILKNAMRALHRLDVRQANEAINKAGEVVRLEKEVTEAILQAGLSTKTAVSLRLILESIKRTSEYSTDIAEIAINLAKKHLRQ
ncbi:AbrB/MazE/SpoVT family DNA-binding domain-containing protein [Candidatus Bathyarchaeota archaeon]|nr:AbrB/MazE/SpoVT family DNA-binding domain-containing protein [Candidatus Bathyarchaeota archaeon]